MRLSSARRFRSRAGFKLAELMMAVSIFAIGGSIAYPLLVGDVGLYARNFSINKSNNSLRLSLQRLKQDINMSIEPPTLVNYRVSGPTGILQPQPTTTVSAPGILLWVNLGLSYDMQPSGNAFTVVPVNSTITLKRRTTTTDAGKATPPPTVPSQFTNFPNSLMPQTGDRLVILSPGPYTTGMPETVTMDGNTIVKPGRRITSVNGQTSGRIVDTNSDTITVTLDVSNTPLPSNITGPQGVYIVRETAYVVNTVTDANGNATERQLIRYPSTADMTNADMLIRDVDPAPLEIDATTKAVIQPFNYYGGRGNLSALTINLPVRAVDYANAISARQLTGSSEFNLYLRSNPQMGVKIRLD